MYGDAHDSDELPMHQASHNQHKHLKIKIKSPLKIRLQNLAVRPNQTHDLPETNRLATKARSTGGDRNSTIPRQRPQQPTH